MYSYLNDLRCSFRGLLHKPLFSLSVVVILALGIAATLCVFCVVKNLILQPLPFRDPQQLVDLRATSPKRSVPEMGLAPPEYLDYKRAAASAFSDVALYFAQTDTYNLSGEFEPERLAGRRVTANLFSVLGVSPALGRAFLQEEESGSGPVVLLSHGIWKRLFGSDPHLIGKTIVLDDTPHTVVGVMPRNFVFPAADVQIWVPLGIEAATAPRLLRQFVAVGRMKPGVTIELAKTEASKVARILAREYPETNTDIESLCRPLYNSIYGENFNRSWSVAAAAVFSLLLIACANVASLLLIRATVHQRDFTIRSVLGANRLRLLWHFLTEGLILTTLASLLAIALSNWGIGLLKILLSAELPRASELRLDGGVLIFALLLGLFIALACSLLPAWSLSRHGMALMQPGARGGGRLGNSLRTSLVMLEIALAFVLLVAAGQLARSFYNLQRVEKGFDPHNLLTVRLSVSENRYATQPQLISYLNRLLEEVRTIPGSSSAALVNELPSSRYVDWAAIFTIEGQAPPPPGQEYIVQHRVVSPGYFRTMGIPILRGRDFDSRDRLDQPMAVVVNETMVKRHFAGQDPIGKALKVLQYRLQIVGVVGDVHLTGPRQPVNPSMYFTYTQNPKYTTNVVVQHSAADLASLTAGLQAAIRRVDNQQPIGPIATLEQELQADILQERALATMLGLLVIIALALATSGIYVVIAYMVTQRTQEVGIRIAMGARRMDVLAIVLRQGLWLAAIGLALGIAFSVVAMRLLTPLLFNIEPFNLNLYGMLSLLMILVSLLASFVPAYRAASLDPLLALRYE